MIVSLRSNYLRPETETLSRGIEPRGAAESLSLDFIPLPDQRRIGLAPSFR